MHLVGYFHWLIQIYKHVESSINVRIINSITRLHLVGYFHWLIQIYKHVEPSINVRIINSITRLHLVGYFYWLIQIYKHVKHMIKKQNCFHDNFLCNTVTKLIINLTVYYTKIWLLNFYVCEKLKKKERIGRERRMLRGTTIL